MLNLQILNKLTGSIKSAQLESAPAPVWVTNGNVSGKQLCSSYHTSFTLAHIDRQKTVIMSHSFEKKNAHSQSNTQSIDGKGVLSETQYPFMGD
jgi:hypothetical protein